MLYYQALKNRLEKKEISNRFNNKEALKETFALDSGIFSKSLNRNNSDLKLDLKISSSRSLMKPSCNNFFTQFKQFKSDL